MHNIYKIFVTWTICTALEAHYAIYEQLTQFCPQSDFALKHKDIDILRRHPTWHVWKSLICALSMTKSQTTLTNRCNATYLHTYNEVLHLTCLYKKMWCGFIRYAHQYQTLDPTVLRMQSNLHLSNQMHIIFSFKVHVFKIEDPLT